jgi:hypothetical protein
MTAEAIANFFGARRIGRGRWMAKCPAHRDRSPSLSIAEGYEGRVLLKCWAGCTLPDLLEAVGLRIRDLFPGPPQSPEQVRIAGQERIRRDAERLGARTEHRRLTDLYRKLTKVRDEVAENLARMAEGPESEAMSKLFHQVQEKLRRIEAVFEAEELQAFHERATKPARKAAQLPEAA